MEEKKCSNREKEERTLTQPPSRGGEKRKKKKEVAELNKTISLSPGSRQCAHFLIPKCANWTTQDLFFIFIFPFFLHTPCSPFSFIHLVLLFPFQYAHLSPSTLGPPTLLYYYSHCTYSTLLRLVLLHFPFPLSHRLK